MICPACSYNNIDGTRFCENCGAALPKEDLPPSAPNRTNQVWNMEIEQEANRKNTRTAMAVLGVMVALLIALTVGMLINLPSTGDFLLGERHDGQSFTDRFGEFWALFTDSIAPEPEPDDDGRVEYPAELSPIAGTADDEFLTDFPALLTFTFDNCYDDIWAASQESRLLEPYRNAEFADPELQALALHYITVLDELNAAVVTDDDGEEYIDDFYSWQLSYCDLCFAVVQLQERYSIFPVDKLYVPVYLAAYGLSSSEQFLLERSFLESLTDINAQWDSRRQAYTVTLTNTSEYTAELVVYNEYETEDDWLYEEDELMIAPHETVTIELEEMPDAYKNWYVDVYVYELYVEEDYTLYDSCWDYYYEQFTE